jgi:hypothetical protein
VAFAGKVVEDYLVGHGGVLEVEIVSKAMVSIRAKLVEVGDGEQKQTLTKTSLSLYVVSRR